MADTKVRTELKNLLQNADRKTEKHVPVIDAPETVEKGKIFKITASVGKEVEHPNTTSHHIRWIGLYFQPADGKFPHHLGSFEFSAHGESAQGPDTGGVYTHHEVTASIRTDKPGTLHALSYCNIHGLWSSSKEIIVGQG